MEKTTIQVNKELLKRLKNFKRHERESYNEIISYLMDEAEDDELSREEVEELQKGLEDVKAGRLKPIEQIAKEMRIKLD